MTNKRSEEEIMYDFFSLVCAASPENLCWDGEASQPQIRQNEMKIQFSWQALEKELGKKVSHDEAYDWYIKQEKKRLQGSKP